MRRALVVMAALLGVSFGASCATRGVVLERWQVLLADRGGLTVVHRAVLHAPLPPFLQWRTVCGPGPSLRAVTLVEGERCNGLEANVRVFELVALEGRTALYRETR
jgi:hypothetical protein